MIDAPTATATRVQRAWQALDGVMDPEVPAVSVRDLGIVRDVRLCGDVLDVVLTPTYSGCPATEVIEADVLAAIAAAGLGPARVTLQRAPAWTTDWITAQGRERLRAYCIHGGGGGSSLGASSALSKATRRASSARAALISRITASISAASSGSSNSPVSGLSGVRLPSS